MTDNGSAQRSPVDSSALERNGSSTSGGSVSGTAVPFGGSHDWKLDPSDIARLPELCARYAGQGPRYTSYPTAVEFSADRDARGVDASRFQDELTRDIVHRAEYPGPANPELPISLYLHLPFCHALCYFCACNKIITQDRSVTTPYLEKLDREMTLYKELLGESPFLPPAISGAGRQGLLRAGNIVQIHWGGGTPNFLSPDEMRELHTKTKAHFPYLARNADVSVELDPRTCTTDHLDALVEVGFNRVSLGVQDFDGEVQEYVHRIQPYEQTRDLIVETRKRGIRSINVDLIYGLPAQTLAGFTKTVEQIIELRPERVALYGYAHVTWIRKVQKALERAHLPTPEERIGLFVRALELFTSAGYRYIGMDHFALPDDTLAKALDTGKLNRNFMGYSTHRGSRILGFGVSSISTLPGAFAQNTKDMIAYGEALREERLPTERGVIRTAEDMLRSEIIEQLMCNGSLDTLEIERDWKIDFAQRFASALEELPRLEADGIVRFDGRVISLTPVGRILSRNVAMLFDEYLTKHRSGAKPTFSQTV